MQKGIITALTFSLLTACGSGSSNNENGSPSQPTEPNKPAEPVDKSDNKKPTVEDVRIQFNENTTLFTGDTLVGVYNYVDTENDPEGNTQFRWLVAGIEKGTSSTYIIEKADADKEITFEVTPIATSGTVQGNPVLSSNVSAKFRNFIIYTAQISANERVTLTTDGTESGTHFLKDFEPAKDQEIILKTQTYQDKVLISLRTDAYGNTLAVTDGSEQGTGLIDTNLNNFYINEFAEFNDKLFFSGRDSTYGSELWVTDGTKEGTALFKDIVPGFIASEQPWSSTPAHLTPIDNKLVFTAYSREYGTELWASDGTSQGTVMIKDLNEGYYGSTFSQFFSFNNKAYFSTDNMLYATDGTTEGTHAIMRGMKNIYRFSPLNESQFVFAANNGSDAYNAASLWISDGTLNGSTEVNTLHGDDSIQEFQVIGDTLYFRTSTELFSYNATDGVEKIESKLTSIDQIITLNDQLYINARTSGNAGLYVLSNSGISLVKQPNTIDANQTMNGLYALNNRIIFVTNDGIHGREVWISDGTSEGTNILVDNLAGEASSNPSLCHLTFGCER